MFLLDICENPPLDLIQTPPDIKHPKIKKKRNKITVHVISVS